MDRHMTDRPRLIPPPTVSTPLWKGPRIHQWIQDDLVIDRINQNDTTHNYTRVIFKLKLAYLKVELVKTHIFPESCDIIGWIWKKGGFLEEKQGKFPPEYKGRKYNKKFNTPEVIAWYVFNAYGYPTLDQV